MTPLKLQMAALFSRVEVANSHASLSVSPLEDLFRTKSGVKSAPGS